MLLVHVDDLLMPAFGWLPFQPHSTRVRFP